VRNSGLREGESRQEGWREGCSAYSGKGRGESEREGWREGEQELSIGVEGIK